MKSPLVTMTLLFAILPALGLPAGSLERQHGAHVHGQAYGTLAVDEGRVSLSLVFPGMNLVGFEHAPRDDAQRARLRSVRQALESGAWLELDPGGDCRVERLDLAMPGFGDDRVHDHDHDHDHDGHGDHHDHEHAEFHLELGVECSRPDRLAWIALDLFDAFPANEEVRIDVLTDTLAERVRLTATNSRIRLR